VYRHGGDDEFGGFRSSQCAVAGDGERSAGRGAGVKPFRAAAADGERRASDEGGVHGLLQGLFDVGNRWHPVIVLERLRRVKRPGRLRSRRVRIA